MSDNADEPLEVIVRRHARQLVKSSTPMLDARLLAQSVLGLSDADFILASPNDVKLQDRQTIEKLVARRVVGEPMAYLLGEKEFRSLVFKMHPGVLVPRPDSETLIDAVEALRSADLPLRILDLGVGSGCLLLTLLMSFPRATGIGVDQNEAAVRLARENAQRLGLDDRATFLKGDWAEALNGSFDLIISNPPYIRTGDRNELPPDVADFEDERALFAGADGLSAYGDLLASAASKLAPDGLLVLELGIGQEHSVRALVSTYLPDATLSAKADLADIPRALVADRQPQQSVNTNLKKRL